MAEFCPECWNKLNNFSDPAESYRLSWGYELCEGCSESKRVVVGKRKHYWHLIVLKKLFQKRITFFLWFFCDGHVSLGFGKYKCLWSENTDEAYDYRSHFNLYGIYAVFLLV